MKNIAQVEAAIKKLSSKNKKESFVFDFLLAFGIPKSTVTMLKNGSRNLSKKDGEMICKKKILFYSNDEINPEEEFERIIEDESSFKHSPRFIVVTNYKKLFALDTKLMERTDFDLKELPKKFDFFLPLANIEKKEFHHENPVDVKAAEKLAKLFDLIKHNNPKSDPESLHALNVFLTRLLFCYFAEDTGIFPKNLFTQSIGSHTQKDGSDLSDYLKRIFAVMNVEARPKDMPDYIRAFPYVNGGLFANSYPIPKFCKRSREALIDVGDLDWAEINPDIFGSMIQAVVDPDKRSGLGMHYTSVTNIMKVIEPLFLNELYYELEKSKGNTNRLKKLLKRVSEIVIFDPACGSGNFLIIAYKELRKLEMLIYKQLPNELKFSYIPLRNFYGIEIDDFAHEVAVLSLWLAEHQMDIMFAEEFGEVKASLPLKDGGNIVCNNATRIDWNDVCPISQAKEVYVIGNPPYQGARKQTDAQKADLKFVFKGFKNYKNLDYIACFFYLGAKYIKKANAKLAFVSTNSLCQGEQVELLWPKVFSHSVNIFFAHKSFKWSNNAKNKAAVICIIVGITPEAVQDKYIYDQNKRHKVKNINAYLIDGPNAIVKRRTKQISNLPHMPKGNMPYDGGHLILSPEEKDKLVRTDDRIKILIKKLVGAKEFINHIERYCLWISDDKLEYALDIPLVKDRIEKVRQMRLDSSDSAAHKLAERPYQFREVNTTNTSSIVVPSATSERRDYIPMGFVDSSTIVSNLAFVIYDAPAYLLGVLISRMHMAWVRAVAGRLKSDYRYSSAICYNTFPFPKLSNDKIESLESQVYKILELREKDSSKTLADLYDPDKMPSALLDAHKQLDEIVDSCYRNKSFRTDDDRLSLLFDLYYQKTGDSFE